MLLATSLFLLLCGVVAATMKGVGALYRRWRIPNGNQSDLITEKKIKNKNMS